MGKWPIFDQNHDDDDDDDDELYSCDDEFSWRELGRQDKDKINNE